MDDALLNLKDMEESNETMHSQIEMKEEQHISTMEKPNGNKRRTQNKVVEMEMKEKDGRRKLMWWIENGSRHLECDFSSKISVDDRHLRSPKSLKMRPNAKRKQASQTPHTNCAKKLFYSNSTCEIQKVRHPIYR